MEICQGEEGGDCNGIVFIRGPDEFRSISWTYFGLNTYIYLHTYSLEFLIHRCFLGGLLIVQRFLLKNSNAIVILSASSLASKKNLIDLSQIDSCTIMFIPEFLLLRKP